MKRSIVLVGLGAVLLVGVVALSVAGVVTAQDDDEVGVCAEQDCDCDGIGVVPGGGERLEKGHGVDRESAGSDVKQPDEKTGPPAPPGSDDGFGVANSKETTGEGGDE